MQFGLILSLFGDVVDARSIAGHECAAEETVRDGVFVWDHIHTVTSP